jgi:hypothetical protein
MLLSKLKTVAAVALVVAGTTALASPAYAQDISEINRAVSYCVDMVHRFSADTGNGHFFRDFDAYVNPATGSVENNAIRAGDQPVLDQFNRCMASQRAPLGTASTPAPTTLTSQCSAEELSQRTGDCWVKLSAWEKRLVFRGIESGWLDSYVSSERQQFNQVGSSQTRDLARFDESKAIPFFDQLYSVPENRTIWWSNAFDLLSRTLTNPKTMDIPGLTALYRQHDRPIFFGYLRKFVSPNKVVVSQFSDASKSQGSVYKPLTVTLLGVSADGNAKPVSDFMTALLNIKQCNTLIRKTEGYKINPLYKTEEDRQTAKWLAERESHPELRVVINYPRMYDYQHEQIFNEKGDISGIVLLEKRDWMCIKKEGELVENVDLGQLMLDGAKYQNEYSAPFRHRADADEFIDLNKYLIANGLRALDLDKDDPRPNLELFPGKANPTPDGVKKILTVGAAQ